MTQILSPPPPRNKSINNRDKIYTWLNSKQLPFVINFLVLGFVEFLFLIYNKFLLSYYSNSEEYLKELVEYSKLSNSSNLVRKVAIVTGASSGIGLETAHHLYKAGYFVILACRNEEKSQKIIDNLIAEDCEGGLKFIHLDCNSLASCKRFVHEFEALELKLDLLINNAGIMMTPYDETENFIESQIGINFISHFYLTNQLIPHFNKESKILNLSSLAAYYSSNLDLEQITKTQFYHPVINYSQSKLANLLFTYYLQKELRDKSIYVYAIHPGMVNTSLYQHDKIANFFNTYFSFLLKDPKVGSFTTLRCALLLPRDDHFDNSLYYCEEFPICAHKSVKDGESINLLINWANEIIEERGYSLNNIND